MVLGIKFCSSFVTIYLRSSASNKMTQHWMNNDQMVLGMKFRYEFCLRNLFTK